MDHRPSSWTPLVAGHRTVYILALGAAALGSLTSYLPPLFLRSILDSGLGHAPWALPAPLASVPAALAALFTAAVVAAGLSFLAGFGTQRSAEGMARILRQRLFGHIQHLGFEDLSKAPTGDWVQRCTSDVDTLRRLAAVQFPELVNNILQACWALPILFILHPGLALFAVPLLPVVLGFSVYFFTQVEKAFRESDESEGRLSGILQENITGVRVVKAFARQDHEVDRFARENAHFRRVTRKLINLFALYWGCVNFLSMCQMGMVLTAGVVFVLEGRASVGTVVMFLTMTGMLVWPIRQLGRVLTDLGKAKVSWGRIREILEKPAEDLGAPLVPSYPWEGRIEFRSVSVRRDGRTLLEDLTFVLEAGTTAALLGPTGSGKSTLVHLLAGLIDYEGEILLDGRELRSIPKGELRRQVGLVLQEPWLFAKTIGENIGLAFPDATQEEIEDAARTARFHEGIEGFPAGYETLLGERGVTLSGGQRQRTAIAQMLLRPRPVLVFDDSLSAVDNHTDAAIRRSLEERRTGGPATTVILISHRLSTLAQADVILVLEKGRLVQTGTHRSLSSVPGLYRRMAELQNALKAEWALEGDL
jgi:ATP-binding cassette subfamily B protein